MTALLYAKTCTYVAKRKQFVLSIRVVLEWITIALIWWLTTKCRI